MTPKDHRSSKISSEAIFATPSMRFSRFIIGTILCIVVTIVDLNSSISNKIRGFSHDLLIPFYLLSELPSNIYREIDFTLKTKLDLKKQIATLERQTYLLKLENSSLDTIRKENNELKSLIGSTLISNKFFTLVTKSRLSNNFIMPILTVNYQKGEEIRLEQPVFSDNGLIGKISSVGIKSAEVMLLSHIDSLIPVISLRTSLHGILQGNGLGKSGYIINMKKTAEFEEGELLVSSGLGGDVPAGYPVGRISSILDKSENKFLEIKVDLISNPQNQDLFLVLTSEDYLGKLK
tara:strand:+ start:10324 stop:11199 length:876 start_codon:yes stop_codon:yes gene_type:complete